MGNEAWSDVKIDDPPIPANFIDLNDGLEPDNIPRKKSCFIVIFFSNGFDEFRRERA